MTVRRYVITFSAVLATVSLPLPAEGQGVGGSFGIQTYRFDDPQIAGVESIMLLTTRFAASAPIGSVASLTVSGAFAEGRATGPTGEQATLSGLIDTQVGISITPGTDWLTFSGNVTVPSGQSTLTFAESFVAAFVAAELLPFAISTWGNGGNVGGDVALATQVGGWGVGLGGGYRVAGEYEPIPDQTLAFHPGDQLEVRLALDRDLSSSGTLSILFGFQSFGADETGGASLFQSGSRFQGVASYAFALGLRNSAVVYGGVSHRANGALLLQESALGGAKDSPSQQLFVGGANLRVPVGRRAVLMPRAEIIVFRASDGASQGWVATTGANLDLRLVGNRSRRRLELSPSAAFRLGNVIVSEGSESSFLGWEVGLTLRVVSGR